MATDENNHKNEARDDWTGCTFRVERGPSSEWKSSCELADIASMAWGGRNFDFHIGMELGRERIKIVCYPHDGKGGPKVASAYIELA